MKTILVPTDFSEAALNAARYALFLAQGLRADLQLLHAFKVPAEARGAAQSAWPLESYEQAKRDSASELDNLRKRLELAILADVSPPHHVRIAATAELGDTGTLVRNATDRYHSPLVVMGMSGVGALHRLFLGSNTRDLINEATFPLLLVPNQPQRHELKKIAFATDLSHTDVALLHSLVTLARPFQADILISHVTDKQFDTASEQQRVEQFLQEAKNKANYSQIYYRHQQSDQVDQGLEWLSEHGLIDMLVMVHRPHALFEHILSGSHTQWLARHIQIPLLVFPPDAHDICFKK